MEPFQERGEILQSLDVGSILVRLNALPQSANTTLDGIRTGDRAGEEGLFQEGFEEKLTVCALGIDPLEAQVSQACIDRLLPRTGTMTFTMDYARGGAGR